ncbi:MAG: hypothetical protein L0H29_08210, partial [Sinobacteraceae bacterium]|nr:hypothetical protein [Nevskiaceae bacterium]
LAKRPNVALTPDARITAGGVEFDFSFRWGQTLVDAVPLHAAATNARLRKALLVLRADADQAMLFVLDDRTDITRADREIALLGEVAPAVALRNLEYATANQ